MDENKETAEKKVLSELLRELELDPSILEKSGLQSGRSMCSARSTWCRLVTANLRISFALRVWQRA